jgi:hypothetical protein
VTARVAAQHQRELRIRRVRALPTLALASVLLVATAGPAGAVGTAGTAPVVQAPIAGFALGATLGTTKVPLRISWPAATTGGAALARYYLQRRVDGGSWSRVTLPSGLSRSVTVKIKPGRLHQFRLRAVDINGAYSLWAIAPPVWLDAAQEDDLDIDYSGDWTKRASTSAFGGALRTSSTSGDTAGLSFTATEFAWVSSRGRSRGRATVSASGQPDAIVDLYRSATATRRIVHVARWAESGERSVGIQVEGTTTRPRVDVDALLTLGPPPVAVLLGAGDIASCSSTNDEATADVVESLPGTVFTAGDNAYSYGSTRDFADCYEPSWGRFRDRTRPTPGNHEYRTPAAAPYFAYFGPVAGTPGQGWYAYDLGTWRVYSINSNCTDIGGCGSTSAQYAWLQADLAANERRCVVAYWHRPRYSSGPHGSSSRMATIVKLLYDERADVVIAGHDHLYERFAPMNPVGVVDATRGIRHFVVGTGGAPLYDPESPTVPNSELIEADTYGVLKLTLSWSAYEWEFVAAKDAKFSDQGSAACH